MAAIRMKNPAPPIFLRDIPDNQARERGESTALVADGEALSYAALAERARMAGAGLRSLGVQPQDRVAWLGRSGCHWFDAFFGSCAIGACLTPLNLRLSPTEIAFVAGDCSSRLLLVTDDTLELAQAAIAQMERAPSLVTVGFASDGLPRLDAPVLEQRAAQKDHIARDDDDVLQLYTSGTTGMPKGVRLTNLNYRRFLELSHRIEGFDYRPDEAVLLVAPLFHVAGFNVAMAGLANGCRVIVHPQFDAGVVLRAIAKERVSRLFLVPTMIRALLDHPDVGRTDLSCLTSISYGASPIDGALLTAAQDRLKCQFVQFYGMTESAGSGTILEPKAHSGAAMRSCGVAWPETVVAILGSDDRILGVGQVGEIAIRGDTVMKGYWNRPDATREVLRNGWLHTGDAGYRDENGYVFVSDRIKDMIITGGENVYPAEVEAAIAGCPGVIEVAVIGIPSERWGEEVKAVVVADSDSVDAERVIGWTRDRIAKYKCPKSVEFVDALPRNASGKVLRRELRQRYAALFQGAV